MLIEKSISVPLSADEAFSKIRSLGSVARCLPTATVTRHDDDSYQGQFWITVGPLTRRMTASVTLVEVDPHQRKLAIRASGRGSGDRSAVDANVLVAIADEAGQGARVAISSDIRLRGPAAHLGREAVDDVIDAVLDQVAATMAISVPEQPTTNEAADDLPGHTPGWVGLPEAAAPRRGPAWPSLIGFVVGLVCGALLEKTRKRRRGRRTRSSGTL
jgi:carbon monoxide dehydrogenase subunit G